MFFPLLPCFISAALDIAVTSSPSQCGPLSARALPFPAFLLLFGEPLCCLSSGFCLDPCPPLWCPLPVTVGLIHACALLDPRQLLLTLPPRCPPGFLTQPVLKMAPVASTSHPAGPEPKPCSLPSLTPSIHVLMSPCPWQLSGPLTCLHPELCTLAETPTMSQKEHSQTSVWGL